MTLLDQPGYVVPTPGWYFNLRARPEAEVRFEGRAAAVAAALEVAVDCLA
jgi:hypothetical protein